MKIIFEDNCLVLRVEDTLERLYLERLGLKCKGDIAKCVLVDAGFDSEVDITKEEKGTLAVGVVPEGEEEVKGVE